MVHEAPLGAGYTRKDGIIYGPDGKPCRQCNSLRDLMNMGSTETNARPFAFNKRPSVAVPEEIGSSRSVETEDQIASPDQDPNTRQVRSFDTDNCPPDVELLGRSTWTFLHTTAANYPPRATPTQQNDMAAFLRTFSMFYPCWVCAEDFRLWMAKRENQPVLDQGWAGLGQWMCRAHNEVNEKLGKEKFDCKLWRQRWKDGFKDGRCDP